VATTSTGGSTGAAGMPSASVCTIGGAAAARGGTGGIAADVDTSGGGSVDAAARGPVPGIGGGLVVDARGIAGGTLIVSCASR